MYFRLASVSILDNSFQNNGENVRSRAVFSLIDQVVERGVY